MQNWYRRIIDYFKKLLEQRKEAERRANEERLKKLLEEKKKQELKEEERKKHIKFQREIEFKLFKEKAQPTNNMEKFPNIVLEPKLVEIDGELYTLFRFKFGGLSDLYKYLKSDPDINEEVFNKNHLSSVTGDYNFAGVKYNTAVENLINYQDPKYKEFINISKKSKVKNLRLWASYRAVNGVSGGVIRPQALATGDPHIYRTTEVYKVDKSVNIYATASYNHDTTKKQVYNKAVILTNIIHALEEEGIMVNVDVFEISQRNNEIVEIDLKIKNNGKNTNYQALYRALCNVEFLRRILFRVVETSNVRNDWRGNYGSSSKEDFIRKLKHLKENDYYFGTPQELGIKGKDLALDFERAVEKLNMKDVIDVEKAKVKIKSMNNKR